MTHNPRDPGLWNLGRSRGRELAMETLSLVDLAGQYGTPLFVINEDGLRKVAKRFVASAAATYPGAATVCFPFKSNGLPAVIRAMKESGLGAEVMTEFELDLALAIGYDASEIIVNGPCKTVDFLNACLHHRVGNLVIDSLQELERIEWLAQQMGGSVDVLLRINPDYVPLGMNAGSATASRKGSAFGLDLKGGELAEAFRMLKRSDRLVFRGLHLHIGTGIRRPADYSNALACLGAVQALASDASFNLERLDVGGGFASPTSWEFTSLEMLLYQAFGVLPRPKMSSSPKFDDFHSVISQTVQKVFTRGRLPALIYEPGRVLTSQNAILLLTVHYVKERRGVGTWLITDGGLGTVTLPTFYEYHEILLCNDIDRPIERRSTITGPACFSGDIVYRNKPMPQVRPGEVLAVMDAGAYFTQLESNFGFARSAVVAVSNGRSRLIRRRENFDDMVRRDADFASTTEKEKWL